MRLVVFVLLFLPSLALAAPVKVAWDPNPPAENVTSYTVHYGPTSRTYTGSKVCGNVTLCEVVLPDGVDEYLAVTAENAFGLRSDYSNEILVKQTIYGRPPAVVSLKTATQNPTPSVSVQFDPSGKISVTGGNAALILGP